MVCVCVLAYYAPRGSSDMFAEESINLLQRSGLLFPRHEQVSHSRAGFCRTFLLALSVLPSATSAPITQSLEYGSLATS